MRQTVRILLLLVGLAASTGTAACQDFPDTPLSADVGSEPDTGTPDNDDAVPNDDAGQTPAATPAHAAITSGGANVTTGKYRLRVTVGGPAPAAQVAGNQYSARVGVAQPNP